MAQLSLGNEVDVNLVPRDAKDNETTPVGVPVWSVEGADFVIVPAADGLTAVLQGVGTTPGAESVLTVVVDGVTVSDDLELVAGVVATASLVFGEQRPIAATPQPM